MIARADGSLDDVRDSTRIFDRRNFDGKIEEQEYAMPGIRIPVTLEFFPVLKFPSCSSPFCGKHTDGGVFRIGALPGGSGRARARSEIRVAKNGFIRRKACPQNPRIEVFSRHVLFFPQGFFWVFFPH